MLTFDVLFLLLFLVKINHLISNHGKELDKNKYYRNRCCGVFFFWGRLRKMSFIKVFCCLLLLLMFKCLIGSIQVLTTLNKSPTILGFERQTTNHIRASNKKMIRYFCGTYMVGKAFLNSTFATSFAFVYR